MTTIFQNDRRCVSCGLRHEAECPYPTDVLDSWRDMACYVPPFLMTDSVEAGLQAVARERDVDEWSVTVHEFTDRVGQLIGTERNGDYGRPRENHARTAGFWRLYIKGRYGIDIALDGLAVCALNRLQKESRMCETPTHVDSLYDVAGFAGNALDCVGGVE